jgi:hypothetical protein
MPVENMKARFAEAQEQVMYAETVGPAQTTKLPPVPERVYRDIDGNIIDPKEVIDTSRAEQKSINDLPVIGNTQDPFITVPMQKIVSDEGHVIAEMNDEVKTFIQPPKKKKGLSARNKAIIILVAIFACIAVAAACLHSAGLLKQEEIVDDSVEEVNNQVTDDQQSDSEIRQNSISASLLSNYQTLGDYRNQVNSVVSDFNNYYRLSDKTKRQSYANECTTLITTVSDSKAKLIEDMNELGLTEDNSLFNTYDQIKRLYDLILTRLNVINECWEVSLSADSPKDHEQEILAPLSSDIKQGKSSSMADFDTLYPQVVFAAAES